MDQETAQLQADYLNELMTEYSDTIYFKIFALWNSQYDKEYQTVLIPTKYDGLFDNANESMKLAFARVSIKALIISYNSADDLVTNYDSVANSDSELSQYINTKP